MNCTDMRERIEDYIDDGLETPTRSRVERHAADCPTCRDALHAARDLRQRAKLLPRSVTPSRDLFPEIRARLEQNPPSDVGRPGTRAGSRAWLAWAGIAAMLLLAFVTAGWLRIPDSGAGPDSSTAAIPASWDADAAVVAAGEDYRRAVAELTAMLDARAATLSPEARAVIDRNLAIIDGAIADVEQALSELPGSPENGRLLADLQHQKVQFLWRVSRLSS